MTSILLFVLSPLSPAMFFNALIFAFPFKKKIIFIYFFSKMYYGVWSFFTRVLLTKSSFCCWLGGNYFDIIELTDRV